MKDAPEITDPSEARETAEETAAPAEDGALAPSTAGAEEPGTGAGAPEAQIAVEEAVPVMGSPAPSVDGQSGKNADDSRMATDDSLSIKG